MRPPFASCGSHVHEQTGTWEQVLMGHNSFDTTARGHHFVGCALLKTGTYSKLLGAAHFNIAFIPLLPVQAVATFSMLYMVSLEGATSVEQVKGYYCASMWVVMTCLSFNVTTFLALTIE